ncbi:MAG: glycosyltransferase family 2 protein [Spirochaetales bacterium]|nr:glycosyltransferase family 2 protein [Spirochaetales bacterium]
MIYIILPTHKKVSTTKLFLQSIRHNLKEKYHIILIDDDKARESSKAFAAYENLTIIKGDGNLWWGGAVNAGIDYLLINLDPKPHDICIFANNDVQITPTTYNKITSALKQNANALYHPRVFDQQGQEKSAGSKVIMWFPYISKHPRDFKSRYARIHLATARFLCFTVQTLKKIGKISKNLPHYGGDNDFSLRAGRFGIPTFIIRDAVCLLDDRETGLSSSNIMSLSDLWRSLISTRSSNNLKYRYRFVLNFFHNHFVSIMIVISMTFTICLKFIRNKILKN